MYKLIENISIVWLNHNYLIATVCFLMWGLLCLFIVKYLNSIGRKLTTKFSWSRNYIKEFQVPIWLLLLIIGFYISARTAKIPSVIVPHINRFTQLAIVFFVIYFVIRLVSNLIIVGVRNNPNKATLSLSISKFSNFVIWCAGLLLALDLTGISITPVLASLGIAGIAIGLGLQDTLNNVFSGIYIILTQTVRVGDYIQVDNIDKGYVVTIGWRAVRIRTLPNNVIIVPNSRVAQGIVTNYHQPQEEMACLVQVGVSYDSDLEKVEKVTIEVGKKVLEKVTGGVPVFNPFIRYHTFADFSINFTVILRVKEYVDQYLVTHEFIKALHKRYNQEGIVIPFPIRTIEMKNK